MGFEKLASKGNGVASSCDSYILRVSKYQDPQIAMELIAHICSPVKDLSYNEEFQPVYNLIKQIDKCQKDEKRGFLWNDDFISNLKYEDGGLWDLERSYNDNTYELKIAIAGGYSSGKSSFLNGLMQKEEFLPTSIEPTSLVNTYINCSKDRQKIVVRGENLKGDLVLLNNDVLDSIRHTNKLTAVANVLKRLIIEVPSSETLSQITFIDTPGYDNSQKVSTETGLSDYETAKKSFKDADVIFWCANIKSQVTSSDFEFIQECEGNDKPIVVILTRRLSISSDAEVKRILKTVFDSCSKHFKKVVDIIAFDKVESSKIFSYKGNTLKSLILEIRKVSHAKTAIHKTKNICTCLFDAELRESQNLLQHKKEEREDLLIRLGKARKQNWDNNDYITDLNKDLERVLIEGYDAVKNHCDTYHDLFIKALHYWKESLQRERGEWEKFVGWFYSPTKVRAARDAAFKQQQSFEAKKTNNINYFPLEERKKLLNEIKELTCRLPSELDSTEELEEALKRCNRSIEAEENCINCLNIYKPLFLKTLDNVDDRCQKKRAKHLLSLQQIEENSAGDVFSAISSNDWRAFLQCFHNGVDIKKCNEQGFNPLTWASYNGNIRMVKFFNDHLAGAPSTQCLLATLDNNGHSMLDVAIISHNKRMCEFLLKKSSEFAVCKLKAEKLSAENNFDKWINSL